MEIVLEPKDAFDWSYRGEGAVNLVLAYTASSPTFVSLFHFSSVFLISIFNLIVFEIGKKIVNIDSIFVSPVLCCMCEVGKDDEDTENGKRWERRKWRQK